MRTKSKMILWYTGLILVAGGISYAAYRFGHHTIAFLVLVVPGALVANGFLAEHEDNAPGGFNNPITKPADEATKKEKNA